jgi:hypothetical protein
VQFGCTAFYLVAPFLDRYFLPYLCIVELEAVVATFDVHVHVYADDSQLYVLRRPTVWAAQKRPDLTSAPTSLLCGRLPAGWS